MNKSERAKNCDHVIGIDGYYKDGIVDGKEVFVSSNEKPLMEIPHIYNHCHKCGTEITLGAVLNTGDKVGIAGLQKRFNAVRKLFTKE